LAEQFKRAKVARVQLQQCHYLTQRLIEASDDYLIFDRLNIAQHGMARMCRQDTRNSLRFNYERRVRATLFPHRAKNRWYALNFSLGELHARKELCERLIFPEWSSLPVLKALLVHCSWQIFR